MKPKSHTPGTLNGFCLKVVSFGLSNGEYVRSTLFTSGVAVVVASVTKDEDVELVLLCKPEVAERAGLFGSGGAGALIVARRGGGGGGGGFLTLELRDGTGGGGGALLSRVPWRGW